MDNLIQSLLLGVVRLVVGARGRFASAPPSARQTIYFANHSSNADTLAILSALPPALRVNTGIARQSAASLHSVCWGQFM
jgi:1-acyl-sn-glycerol-3-phosphate acyltransferase